MSIADATSHTIPVMWNNGARPKRAQPSASPLKPLNAAALVAMLPWVLVAPFGVPLVPEV